MLPHTNEAGLKQVALSSRMKKGKKIYHGAQHNRKPLPPNLEKKAWSCGKGTALVVLLENLLHKPFCVPMPLTYLCDKTLSAFY